MSDLNDYTVGWICAISTEYVAAQVFLDDEHEQPEYLSPGDSNDYQLGRIGRHNVVIAVLPDGEYGTTSAATVARDMMHSFPCVMVGIGGGAPSQQHDIRLGDVVISVPRDGKSGVLQYDFSKTIQKQRFQRTGVMNQPPTVLRTAVSGLRAQYTIGGHKYEEHLERIFQKHPRLRKQYSRPDLGSDRLYKSKVVHPADASSCVAACGIDPLNLVIRSERTQDDDNPAIHYGIIALGNQLMKNALIRDNLAAKEDILCFEMEAAGLMNHFPCLVIRGICDYSDSHKNKEWQGYAAMVAAAYAKDLLYRIVPNKIEAEKKIVDILSDVHQAVEDQRDIAEQTLQTQKYLVEEKLSGDKQRCHQLFRLTTGSRDTTYEWYKDRVEERVPGTCMWFLKHENFQTWLDQESGLLLVSVDPGCGKSVLARYLVDHYLVDHYLSQPTTICYFFFKDKDQDTIRQALCALLHQLFSQQPSLIEYAMPQFQKDGQGLINSTKSLWKILHKATKDPKAGSVIMVLDALDECVESEFADLIRNVESQFSINNPSHGKLKYLLTCRPYNQIISKFCSLLDNFPNIHIPGEEESAIISQEVNLVITCRVNQLSMKKRLSRQVKSHLEKRLLRETTHRTYLWVYLVFDFLGKEDFKTTPKGIESTIATLPRSIDEAYEQILNKIKGDLMSRALVRKALSIILAASRPLTLLEMNIAMNIEIDQRPQSFHDLDLEGDEDFKRRLRSWCGLFVSIHRGSVYFLHQTAREFLLADPALAATPSSELHWYHSITTQYAHGVLAEICVVYLDLFNSGNVTIDESGTANANFDALLEYAASAWGAHLHKASVVDSAADILTFAMRIPNPDSKSFSAWSGKYWMALGRETPWYLTDLMVASHYGHDAIVKLLLDKGANIEAVDKYKETPLSWAIENGHEAIVKLLLEKGANIEVMDNHDRTLLYRAIENGHEAIVKLLLEKVSNVEVKHGDGQTLLSRAAGRG
ncbi:hypothetical protein BGZ63DRAFT_455093 [Mariannaea sp. PMI_226]|nr:hypothetical protein BGZ63DRAFT_455093 [Mariannaea sp. PMI_226]